MINNNWRHIFFSYVLQQDKTVVPFGGQITVVWNPPYIISWSWRGSPEGLIHILNQHTMEKLFGHVDPGFLVPSCSFWCSIWMPEKASCLYIYILYSLTFTSYWHLFILAGAVEVTNGYTFSLFNPQKVIYIYISTWAIRQPGWLVKIGTSTT